MNIPAVPESITRSRLCEILRSLGIDPMQVGPPGVRIGLNSVECSVYALNDEGKRYLEMLPDEEQHGDVKVAMHTITVPVVED